MTDGNARRFIYAVRMDDDLQAGLHRRFSKDLEEEWAYDSGKAHGELHFA